MTTATGRATSTSAACALCERPSVEVLVEFGDHPIAHHLPATRDEPLYTHPVTLGCCPACGLTQLVDPIPPERLYAQYNWLSAWKWNPHVPQLVELLATRPDLDRAARIVEIGSNDGSFLAELRERGFNNVVGVEPAADAAAAAETRGIPTTQRYWDARLAADLVAAGGPADVVIARQVLEHVQDLGGFADGLRAVMRPGTHVLVEVPDFGFNQAAPDYSAIWEEHVNHFTSETLAWFLARVGVQVERMETAVFSGQILIAYGRYDGNVVDTVAPHASELLARAREYAERWPRFRAALREHLADERRAGRCIALYGGGCRSCCLVNYAGLGSYLELVLDDQEAKQGRFLPGSGLPIVSSEGLAERPIDLCLLAVNAENEEAVIARHGAYVARGGRFVSLHPPSPRLPQLWHEV